ncbi:hypothetical protein [Sphingobium subterraneum]|uniref:Uncharacterized protein n=1 Tax=Sphingobium subterraneum TaxID=627688 RepID=A0A841IWC4_9SPHN|nr:hypothetical protein [Sphingobium subterraneum]MBB6122937.1 hypothetical protein [Sphingobium subterraneum]
MDDQIWLSIANSKRIFDEADALAEALQDCLAEVRPAIEPETFYEEGYEPDEWTTTAYLLAHLVRKTPGLPASGGHVTFLISLWRPEDEQGVSWSAARQAKLYVGFQPSARVDGWTMETLCIDGDGNSIKAKPGSDFLWHGTGSETMRRAWFFCVRLAGLENRDEVRREIIDPLTRLFANVPEKEAFAGCEATIPVPKN